MKRIFPILVLLVAPLLMGQKQLVVRKGYLPIRNTADFPLTFQYVGADKKCVFAPQIKPVTLKPNQKILFPIHLNDPCDAKVKFRIMKINVKYQSIDIKKSFVSRDKVKKALQEKKNPVKIL